MPTYRPSLSATCPSERLAARRPVLPCFVAWSRAPACWGGDQRRPRSRGAHARTLLGALLGRTACRCLLDRSVCLLPSQAVASTTGKLPPDAKRACGRVCPCSFAGGGADVPSSGAAGRVAARGSWAHRGGPSAALRRSDAWRRDGQPGPGARRRLPPPHPAVHCQCRIASAAQSTTCARRRTHAYGYTRAHARTHAHAHPGHHVHTQQPFDVHLLGAKIETASQDGRDLS
jgi:hypothetical protein